MNTKSVALLAYFSFLCGSVSGDLGCTSIGGTCQYTSTSCSGNYQSNLCNGPSTRKCCVPNTGDVGCTSISGTCQYTSTSCSGNYQSNLCSGPSTRKCCVTGSCSGSASACRILALHNSGEITLQNRHPSGVNDGAFPLLNIQDACNGQQSERSSYSCGECSSGPAPGGSVCIDNRVLSYIEAIAELHSVTITSITGACHSCTSKHYLGRAVDIRRNGPYSSYVTKCNQLGGRGIDEGTHIHCQFG
ncbi:hypothetical protein LOTGIDRAFT_163736 [Lottia gigantea]|uniref:Peptidase M23 domain-containing protein n=1 Tax=Lottia gigantea TaxID=225164 RepID=V4AC49_LOTGI|nr:hypothetical protein LOTGIDRAFT_163736 [Lottia gigantea]ESO90851.1 hypothetical protein LOTGIDRAFT_163736 [Lottia gigantea]